MPYDSYVPPPRAAPPCPEYSNTYRPNSDTWRPGRSYYSRSPSPDRYDTPRGPEVDSWGRYPSSWEPSSSYSWLDRRPLPPRPSIPFEPANRRETMAERMFEPSENWKQTHHDRPGRSEINSPVDRYSESRWDQASERSSRNFSPPYHRPVGGDRYRPSYSGSPPYNSAHLNPRSDSYRPNYDDPLSWDSRYVRDASPPGGNFKGDLQSQFVPRNPSPTIHSNGLRIGNLPPVPRGQRKSLQSYTPTEWPAHLARSEPTYDEMSRQPWYPGEHLSRKKVKSRSSSRSSVSSRTRAARNPPDDHQRQASFSKVDDSVKPPVPTGDSKGKGVLKPHPSPPRSREHETPHPPPLGETSNQAEESTEVPEPHYYYCSSPSYSIASSSRTPIRDVPAAEKNPQDIQKPEQADIPIVETNSRTSQEPKSKSSPGSPPGLNSARYKTMDYPPKSDHVNPVAFATTSASPHMEIETAAIEKPPSPQPQQVPLSKNEDTPVPVAGPSNTTTSQTTTEEPHPTEPSVLHSDSPDVTMDEIPDLSNAKTIAEALRIVAKTRAQFDRQTRSQRVNPVLIQNRLFATLTEYKHDDSPKEKTSRKVVEEARSQDRLDRLAAARPSLVQRFAERQAALSEKTQRLRDEYRNLHEAWLTHCVRLDSAAKPGSVPDETVQPAGRTTRRSTAIMGDAVRSDLEMEQIIASLGIDELTDPNHLALRNVAKIPDMISVTSGQVDYQYDDTNNLVVEDPNKFYDPETGIDDWTEEEKEILLEKYAAYPKQFGLIAEHLPSKTPSQCVTYYYLHKKQFIDFRKVILRYAPGKRKRGGRREDKQKGNALLTDIRKHDDEVSRGTASNGLGTRRKRGMPTLSADMKKPPSSRRGIIQLELTPTSTPTPEPDTKRSRRKVTRSHALLDNDEDDGMEAEPRVVKRGRKSRKPKTPVTVTEDSPPPTLEQNESISHRKPLTVSVHWSNDDKSMATHDETSISANGSPTSAHLQASLSRGVDLNA